MNKQIEEMTKHICIGAREGCDGCGKIGDCSLRRTSERLYNAGYRKSTDVVVEVLEILSELKENYLADDDVREACAISYAEIKIVALKKKYESEGADDD